MDVPGNRAPARAVRADGHGRSSSNDGGDDRGARRLKTHPIELTIGHREETAAVSSEHRRRHAGRVPSVADAVRWRREIQRRMDATQRGRLARARYNSASAYWASDVEEQTKSLRRGSTWRRASNCSRAAASAARAGCAISRASDGHDIAFERSRRTEPSEYLPSNPRLQVRLSRRKPPGEEGAKDASGDDTISQEDVHRLAAAWLT